MQEIDPSAELRDIILPAPSGNLWVWAACAFALVLLGLLLWKLRHLLQPTPSTAAPDPRKESLLALDSIRQGLPNLSENALGFKIAEVIGNFLHAEHGDKALFETTEEMAQRTRQMKAYLSEDEIEHIQQVCECCDYIKYTGTKISDDDKEHLVDATEMFLKGNLAESANTSGTPSQTD